ncbi:MAG: NAD(P)-dependent oxidoreductase, partial [Thermoplasmata archaeon]|nr:NAD(P)-dependent oxidoreductase [Thermoplasmata archaeon]
MRVLILGGAGVLGSNLTEFFLSKGFDVKTIDIVRREEAWRLASIIDQIDYSWKSSFDLVREDVKGIDIIVECAAQADRPLGNNAPWFTTHTNLFGPLRLLEIVRRLKEKPTIIYPSSFNSLYGHKPGTTFTERTLPLPSSVYGWSKGCAELLYLMYHKAFNVPVIITRTGSAFGPRMRSDELVARLIIYALKNRSFYLRSPEAKRLWTYGKDILSFYEKLIEKIDEAIGMTLICAGNKNDEIITNIDLANRVKKLTNSDYEIIPGEYEPGEKINGKPINFKIDSSFTRKFLNWKPKYTIEDGLR